MFGSSVHDWKELKGISTATEIFRQPELWLETLKIVEFQREKIDKFITENLIKENIRVIFTGAGTSAYIGDIVSSQLNKGKTYIFESIPSTDIVVNPETYFKKNIPTLLVSFARSGNSPESIAVYDLANKLIDDVSHVFITCNKDGKLAEIAQNKENVLLLMMPEESNDKGFAMTSSFSCMTLAAVLVFNIKAFEEKKKQVMEMVEIGDDVLKNQFSKLNKLIDYDFERVVYLGSGSFYGLSKESSLKLLELTRGQITSFSETILGFRHGPKSILNDKTLVFIFLSLDEYSRKYDLDLLNEIYHDLGDHKVIAISNNYLKEVEELSDHYIYLSKEKNNINDDEFAALLYALFAQVLALKVSIKTKIEPDNPSPSGLVNRVVKGVNIYEYN
ncbi:SIS domain-containing protein [Tissierella carlieri]|uniref:SIS domain-containing protein n=1 Tax=Tissierella carlieri TaxID=689904 RepID=UPI001C128124|nr:SIS domain-containing protein [Tissierella carlieri]MBU5311629.1 SIS domain-containing protein [Tissierella carlieri]